MRKFDAVLFDVDGTLLDTSEGILVSVKETIEHFGYEMLPDDVLKTFIGPPIEMSFEKHFGLKDEALKETAAYFRQRYSRVNLLAAEVYDGIYDFLDFLKENNIGIGIATYKKQDYAERILKHFHFDDYTDIIYGSDYEGKLKKSDIILLCIDRLGISRDRILMVGDTKHDARGAEAIDVPFAGVSFGFGFEHGEDINDYPHVAYVDNAVELEELFKD